MAVNQSDKKKLMNRILPKVDCLASATGLQILCDRITTPRFVKFDTPGKCKLCKSEMVEVTFCVEKTGVWIDCNRIKGLPFVPFDIIRDFPKHSFFKLKSRARIFSIPLGDKEGNEDDDDDDGDELGDNMEEQASQNLSEIGSSQTLLKDQNVSEITPKNMDTCLETGEEIIFLGEKKGEGTIEQQKEQQSKIVNVKQEIMDDDDEMVSKKGSSNAVEEHQLNGIDEGHESEHNGDGEEVGALGSTWDKYVDDRVNRIFWSRNFGI